MLASCRRMLVRTGSLYLKGLFIVLLLGSFVVNT